MIDCIEDMMKENEIQHGGSDKFAHHIGRTDMS
jgi:hypothetical protein